MARYDHNIDFVAPTIEVGNSQFIVLDFDGYLLQFTEDPGQRKYVDSLLRIFNNAFKQDNPFTKG